MPTAQYVYAYIIVPTHLHKIVGIIIVILIARLIINANPPFCVDMYSYQVRTQSPKIDRFRYEYIHSHVCFRIYDYIRLTLVSATTNPRHIHMLHVYAANPLSYYVALRELVKSLMMTWSGFLFQFHIIVKPNNVVWFSIKQPHHTNHPVQDRLLTLYDHAYVCSVFNPCLPTLDARRMTDMKTTRWNPGITTPPGYGSKRYRN